MGVSKGRLFCRAAGQGSLVRRAAQQATQVADKQPVAGLKGRISGPVSGWFFDIFVSLIETNVLF
jgi:hypothetical protein